jgi:hypothetical protein
MPIIPAIWKVKIGGSQFKASQGRVSSVGHTALMQLFHPATVAMKAGREHMRKREWLCSNKLYLQKQVKGHCLLVSALKYRVCIMQGVNGCLPCK